MTIRFSTILKVFSLQDTLIGYEALSRYALNEKNRFIYQMEITIESTYVPGWNHTVRYTPETWMKMHFIEIPDARGQVKARAKGTGYAVMMVSIQKLHSLSLVENIRAFVITYLIVHNRTSTLS